MFDVGRKTLWQNHLDHFFGAMFLLNKTVDGFTKSTGDRRISSINRTSLPSKVRIAAEKAPEAVATCYEQTDIPKASRFKNCHHCRKISVPNLSNKTPKKKTWTLNDFDEICFASIPVLISLGVNHWWVHIVGYSMIVWGILSIEMRLKSTDSQQLQAVLTALDIATVANVRMNEVGTECHALNERIWLT